jgi:hypothetical protein
MQSVECLYPLHVQYFCDELRSLPVGTALSALPREEYPFQRERKRERERERQAGHPHYHHPHILSMEMDSPVVTLSKAGGPPEPCVTFHDVYWQIQILYCIMGF